MERRQRLALEADEPVRIVLEHEQVVLGRELDDATTAVLRERAPARVLEGREQVEERRRLAARERGLERVRIEAFVVAVERDDLGTELAQDLQGPVVRRPLDEHAPPGSESLRKEDESLQRAVGEEDARGVDAVPFGSPVAQRPVAGSTARTRGSCVPSRSSAPRAQSASSATGRHSGAGQPRAREIVAAMPET